MKFKTVLNFSVIKFWIWNLSLVLLSHPPIFCRKIKLTFSIFIKLNYANKKIKAKLNLKKGLRLL